MYNSYFVNLWVTNRCNFKCRYCYVQPNNNDLDLTIETVDKIIKFISQTIKSDQALIVNFHGGEPLLNFDVIIYFIEKCDSKFKNVSYGMTTNGYLLNDNIIEFIAKKFRFNLSISIDGMENTHEYNRVSLDGKRTHRLIMDNAKKLLYLNPGVRVRMTFDKENVDSLFENIKYVIDNKYKNVKLKILEETFESLNFCTAGHGYFSIDVQGNIYPCIALVGNNKHIIGDVINGINKNKLKELEKVICQEVSICDGCKLYDYCEATRCLLVNYATTGDYLKPNLVKCNMMNVQLCVLEE